MLHQCDLCWDHFVSRGVVPLLNQEYLPILFFVPDKTLFSGFPDAMFPSRFAAYRHFRSNGWLPKAGSKYGVDFLLYPKLPQVGTSSQKRSAHSHAEHCVVVVSAPSDSSEANGEPVVPWIDIHRYHRLALQVGKSLLLAMVIAPPKHASEEDSNEAVGGGVRLIQNSSFWQHASVRTLALTRWEIG